MTRKNTAIAASLTQWCRSISNAHGPTRQPASVDQSAS
ncbi:Uncharacterised protein [Mycobacteroides abscessus]|nr:Uncharacterised protein [Mycobacteroides abscessus]